MGIHFAKDASVHIDQMVSDYPINIIRIAKRLDDNTRTAFDPTVRLAVLNLLEKDLHMLGFSFRYSEDRSHMKVWSTTALTQNYGQTLKSLVDAINQCPIKMMYENSD